MPAPIQRPAPVAARPDRSPEALRDRLLELGFPPETVKTAISKGIESVVEAHKLAQEAAGLPAEDYVTEEYVEELHAEMLKAAVLRFMGYRVGINY